MYTEMAYIKATIKHWYHKTTKENSFSSIHDNDVDANSWHAVFLSLYKY